MVLDVPNLRMKADYDCGTTACRIVYGFYDRPFPDCYEGLSNPARGISPETVEAVIRSEFGGVCWGQGWTIYDLEFHMNQGRPVMCLISVEEAADHWVVVRGMKPGFVLYQDPARGRRTTSFAKWLKLWTGPPNNAYSRFGLVGWRV